MTGEHTVFLIAGCQRSGSTLLEAILAAHPKVRVVGEERWASYGYFEKPDTLTEIAEQWVGLRIPAATHRIGEAIQNFPEGRVLFMLRDPRDVVVSMRGLEMREDNWLVSYGHNEIRETVTALPERDRLQQRLQQVYEETDDLNDVRFGAFCWAFKNRFIPLYSGSSLPTEVVRYEVLIERPEPCLRQICEHLRLDWDDCLLEHEKHVEGAWGGTDKGEAIHRRSMETYRSGLTMDDRRKIHSAIEPEMEMFGYAELFD